jgi:hypothetical protein
LENAKGALHSNTIVDVLPCVTVGGQLTHFMGEGKAGTVSANYLLFFVFARQREDWDKGICLSFIIRFILFSLWRSSLRAGAAGTTTNDA